MKQHFYRQVLSSLLALCLTLLTMGMLFRYFFRPNPKAALEVSSFAQKITFKDTKFTVRRTLEKSGYKYLSLRSQPNSKTWIIGTPWEFGSKNWEVYVNFADDRVIGVFVRTADSFNEKPIGSPFDRGVTNIK